MAVDPGVGSAIMARASLPPGRRTALAVVLALAVIGLAPASALAGRFIGTGHDADLHCSGGQQCHYVKVAVSYVRAGAPNPNLPVLILDRGSLEMQSAVDAAFGAGVVPRKVVDPRSPEFASLPINTATYSAILVASDTTCGGCDLNESDATPDSDAINARKADIEAFFNDGGGIFAGAGASHGDGDPSTGPDTYYNFLPLPVGGKPVSAPFKLTDLGKSLGFEDAKAMPPIGTNDDINCCATHNSFTLPPAGGPLGVAETDNAGLAETLVVEGKVSGGGFVPPSSTKPPAFGPGGIVVAPSNKKCVSRRNFRIRLRQPKGAKIVGATVKVNGRTVATRRGSRVTAPVDLRGLPKGRFTVSITILLDNGKIVRGSRRYRTCTPKRRGGRPKV
jgi:hypothetical protein